MFLRLVLIHYIINVSKFWCQVFLKIFLSIIYKENSNCVTIHSAYHIYCKKGWFYFYFGPQHLCKLVKCLSSRLFRRVCGNKLNFSYFYFSYLLLRLALWWGPKTGLRTREVIIRFFFQGWGSNMFFLGSGSGSDEQKKSFFDLKLIWRKIILIF